ncbi:hypothetical protein ACIQZB_40560 [Streptomyces sp. NPDC097727]|uniref:hypothetical protein n=1 Tax=Streptomyces sp. NPDC097727 TaxID=3366092 RepID=UPI0038090234
MRLGLALPFFGRDVHVDGVVRAAEEPGYDSLWTGDGSWHPARRALPARTGTV